MYTNYQNYELVLDNKKKTKKLTRKAKFSKNLWIKESGMVKCFEKYITFKRNWHFNR